MMREGLTGWNYWIYCHTFRLSPQVRHDIRNETMIDEETYFIHNIFLSIRKVDGKNKSYTYSVLGRKAMRDKKKTIRI